MRGPLVYCFEGLDSPNAAAKVASQFVLAADQQFKTESKEIIPGMTVDAIVARDSSGKAITAIPYFARAYRKETSMSVWAQQTDLKLSSGAAAEASWKGMLYRRLTAKELGQR
jgi:DUF1680 family protein